MLILLDKTGEESFCLLSGMHALVISAKTYIFDFQHFFWWKSVTSVESSHLYIKPGTLRVCQPSDTGNTFYTIFYPPQTTVTVTSDPLALTLCIQTYYEVFKCL